MARCGVDMTQPCPACTTEAPVLEGASADTYVWYYLCPHCGHAWAVSRKDDTDVHHVTPMPPRVTAQPVKR